MERKGIAGRGAQHGQKSGGSRAYHMYNFFVTTVQIVQGDMMENNPGKASWQEITKTLPDSIVRLKGNREAKTFKQEGIIGIIL